MIIDADGWAVDPKVTRKPFPNLNHGKMAVINGIIVHQTASPTAEATFNSYGGANPNGAHFLIDKDGTLYQTASIKWKLWHVGKLKPRCVLENTCPATEVDLIVGNKYSNINEVEKEKPFPERFPMNDDSIGIEIVSMEIKNGLSTSTFEPCTDAQNKSLHWLVDSFKAVLKYPTVEIYRHPDVSYKNKHEAETAAW
ncbi:peptidoglycan recognition protein family protein [Nitrospirillum amazonense]|uniref:N-acetylmuramoyl-L-alanine amidase n=1 Tax=Nitrospirillum amazonense TaxID=28077 RepID=A0A560JB19_9PROT|nr:N-acetylmuramoyl-L-alanine amidase [Nitrospirillum amazonense]MDG3442548.1 N-acetylmuramoyl-L-alanine amidase [Nitrospirillum amazonense]TWB68378.1 N-acetylmuramoyl-L-alanine amidase [Nitrospirillum amazonense]